jgi:hypothetical protein
MDRHVNGAGSAGSERGIASVRRGDDVIARRQRVEFQRCHVLSVNRQEWGGWLRHTIKREGDSACRLGLSRRSDDRRESYGLAKDGDRRRRGESRRRGGRRGYRKLGSIARRVSRRR